MMATILTVGRLTNSSSHCGCQANCSGPGPCTTTKPGAALRPLFELKDAKGSSVDLYFGPTAFAGQGGHWIQTIPGKGWFSNFRLYGPEAAAFGGSWRPGDFEIVR